MTFVAGPHTATFTPPGGTALALGVTQDGYELEYTKFWDPIRGDNMGETIQDGVIRGGDCFLSFVLNEYDSAAGAKMFWPEAIAAATDLGKVGQVGRLASSLAGSLVLTPVAGTSAATIGPATLTAAKAILAPGFPVKFLFATRLRTVPIRLQLLPYVDGSSVTRWFETT